MVGRGRRDREAKKRGRDYRDRSTAKHVLIVSSTLFSAGLSLIGGIVIGGWIAFETPYWQEFRKMVERIPIGSALSLGIVLVIAAAGIGLVTALGNHSS